MTSAAIPPHTLSVVIPVYRGESTLGSVVSEITDVLYAFETPGGARGVLAEILLVHDNGPDASDDVIRELEAEVPVVRGVWLTRNFGQHAATLAGMASSGSEWIVTMDEDGQHDPRDIAGMLDTALLRRAHLVYGAPVNKPPHGALRTGTSRLAKKLMSALVADKRNDPRDYQSFRLILGEVGRSVAAYSGAGVYLDIALGWITSRVESSPVTLREEGRTSSGYSYRSLASHFWRMVLSSGTRGLRIVSILGALFAVAGVVFAIVLFVERLVGGNVPAGWTSLLIVILLAAGATLFSLGVIAEYLGVAVNMAMGKPPYVIIGDPQRGPLGRTTSR